MAAGRETRIVAVGAGVPTPAGFEEVAVGRGTALGNPYPVEADVTARRAVPR